jgi:hypothetical protein
LEPWPFFLPLFTNVLEGAFSELSLSGLSEVRIAPVQYRWPPQG